MFALLCFIRPFPGIIHGYTNYWYHISTVYRGRRGLIVDRLDTDGNGVLRKAELKRFVPS